MVADRISQGSAQSSGVGPRASGWARRMHLAGAWLAMAAAVLWAAGCWDSGPVEPDEAAAALIISDTVLAPSTSSTGGGFTAARAEASAPGVAYVSLPPGTIADGELAVIRPRRNTTTVTAVMEDGGFDPVAVTAKAGDTLDVDIRVGGNGEPVDFELVVPEYARPRVVRVYPPHKKRDVPLNVFLQVVFSEPIDHNTLTGESVQLWRNTGINGIRLPVGGTLELRDPSALTATFAPETSLAANAEYELVVTTRMRDLDGEALTAPAGATFRTGNSLAVPTSMVIAPNPVLSVPYDESGPWGNRIPLGVSLLDATGNELSYSGGVQWGSSDSAVFGIGLGGFSSGLSVVGGDEYARAGKLPGSAVLTASGGGLQASTTVLIEDVTWHAVSVGGNGLICYLAVEGTTYCTGNNHLGQLGIGLATQYHAEQPVGVAGGLAFTSVSSGGNHSCGLTAEGRAYCWGENSHGQLGDGTNVPWRAKPTPVLSGLSFTQIGAGWVFTCALSGAGKAYCWGNYGSWKPADDLGPGPTPVPGDLTFTQLGVGAFHACGLDAGGAAYCWGSNWGGQLGDGSATADAPVYAPVAVVGGHTFAAIDGGHQHTCGVTTDGTPYCWGGENGGTFDAGVVTVPKRIDLPPGVGLVDVAAGWMLTCGRTADAEAYCWGWAWPSEGDALVIPPQRVGQQAFRSVAAGHDRACGITTDSKVQCWHARDLVQP